MHQPLTGRAELVRRRKVSFTALTIVIYRWAELMQAVDVIATPTGAGSQLVATNLTGHPALILPNGFRDDGTLVSFTFLGRLFGEAILLRVALAYQQATPHHLKHPSL